MTTDANQPDPATTPQPDPETLRRLKHQAFMRGLVPAVAILLALASVVIPMVITSGEVATAIDNRDPSARAVFSALAGSVITGMATLFTVTISLGTMRETPTCAVVMAVLALAVTAVVVLITFQLAHLAGFFAAVPGWAWLTAGLTLAAGIACIAVPRNNVESLQQGLVS